VDSNVHQQPEKWVQSACVLCSNGCGLDIGVRDGRIVGVRGRGGDRVNRGRLGPKGLHAWVANHSRERLLHPLIRKRGKLEQASWEEAMDLLVRKTRETIQKHNEHARLCTSTAANALIESFGTDGQPGTYVDFDLAECIFMVGALRNRPRVFGTSW
jgi:anaerobic selenocysteine-containing dehydrogenase